MSMDLLIKIPKEFEQHFKQDAFEDSLNRLCVDAHLLAGLYEQETAKMLIDAFKSAVPIPPHGDLIDRDALPWENQGFMMTDQDEWGLKAYDIEHAPTIIEAEEGE